LTVKSRRNASSSGVPKVLSRRISGSSVSATASACLRKVVAEQVAHLLRMGRSGDVEILGLAREHQVAHAASHQVGFVAGACQAIENLENVGVDIAARDGMLGAR
jgi:hypothetical protein